MILQLHTTIFLRGVVFQAHSFAGWEFSTWRGAKCGVNVCAFCWDAFWSFLFYQGSTLQYCRQWSLLTMIHKVIIHRISQLIKLNLLVMLWDFNVQLLLFFHSRRWNRWMHWGVFYANWVHQLHSTRSSTSSIIIFASQRSLLSQGSLLVGIIKYVGELFINIVIHF